MASKKSTVYEPAQKVFSMPHSDEAEKHLFDKFYQGDSSHKEQGNGLGLSLAKRIITICGGEITAMNREEGGCRFKVVLKGEDR